MSLYLIHYGVLGMKWGVRRSKAELKAAREKAIKEYQDSVIKVNKSKFKNGLPKTFMPNVVVDRVGRNNVVLQRGVYGKDAVNKLIYDLDDHGNRKNHPTGAHKHLMDYKLEDPHGKWLALTTKELAYNSDIIQRGKNYFDEVYLRQESKKGQGNNNGHK